MSGLERIISIWILKCQWYSMMANKQIKTKISNITILNYGEKENE